MDRLLQRPSLPSLRVVERVWGGGRVVWKNTGPRVPESGVRLRRRVGCNNTAQGEVGSPCVWRLGMAMDRGQERRGSFQPSATTMAITPWPRPSSGRLWLDSEYAVAVAECTSTVALLPTKPAVPFIRRPSIFAPIKPHPALPQTPHQLVENIPHHRDFLPRC
jgi:hypothetical protein